MNHQQHYREFCRSREDLPVFVQDWYLDAACEGGVWDAALVWEDGTIVAALPYFLKEKMGFRYIAMPKLVKMMGPYFAPAMRTLTSEHRLMEQLLQQLPPFAAFRQNFHYAVTNWLPFYWNGFQQTTRYTYLLDVADLEQVYQGINRNLRRNIQKARDQGIRILHDRPAEVFYRLNQLSFQRQGLQTPFSYEEFIRRDQALAGHQARQFFFAVDNKDRVHSVAYLIWDSHSGYYHLSGDDPGLRQSGAGILLAWEAIRYTSQILGLKRFDFEGSMMRNVEAIRRQFGAVQQPYFEVWKNNSRWLEAIQWVRRL